MVLEDLAMTKASMQAIAIFMFLLVTVGFLHHQDARIESLEKQAKSDQKDMQAMAEAMQYLSKMSNRFQEQAKLLREIVGVMVQQLDDIENKMASPDEAPMIDPQKRNKVSF
jgi:hypothetical protein